MPVVSIHSPDQLEAFLRQNVYLYLYCLGDLDPFFWPKTVWFANETNGTLEAVLLLYIASAPPTLVALGDPPNQALHQLIRDAGPYLPTKMYAHISPDCVPVFAECCQLRSNGTHYKMGLTNPDQVAQADPKQARPVTEADLHELNRLYQLAYPGNWFDATMLGTGCYFATWDNDQIVSVAGVHTVSRQYKIAALGNIATHPDYRGQGLARATTARLCQALLPDISHIGLNVKATNQAALRCYQSLGFEIVAEYEECVLERRDVG